MIAPNMTTTLTFIATDAVITQDLLQRCLGKAMDKSFNMMSVDTDTSTSDMALCFASGQKAFSLHDKNELSAFQELLDEVCIQLAKKIARDGEGASKLIEVTVNQATSLKDARQIAKSIIDSPLVKTAIHGEDPNWGRIMMAIGKVEDVKINPKRHLYALETRYYLTGEPTGIDLSGVRAHLSKKRLELP